MHFLWVATTYVFMEKSEKYPIIITKYFSLTLSAMNKTFFLQTMQILMRQLIMSSLIRIYIVCHSILIFDWDPYLEHSKMEESTLETGLTSLVFTFLYNTVMTLIQYFNLELLQQITIVILQL